MLITDAHAGRIVEVTRSGEKVWETSPERVVLVGNPVQIYKAQRISRSSCRSG